MFTTTQCFAIFFYVITVFHSIESNELSTPQTKVEPPNNGNNNHSGSQSITQHAAIQIIILTATIILIVFVSVLLCSICCKHYRSPDNPFFGRRSSVASIQELIRERLQDRPPSYHEAQNSVSRRTDDPPPYQEIVTNTVIVNTISSKVHQNVNVEDASTECDLPPNYQTTERVLVVTSALDNDSDSNIFNNEMYI